MPFTDTTVTEFRLKLFVTNIEERKHFYEHVIGWPILLDHPKLVMFDTGPAVLELLEKPEAEAHNTSCDVSLMVEDVYALWERLKDVAPVVSEIHDSPWGDTGFKIADPGGYHLTFFSHTKK